MANGGGRGFRLAQEEDFVSLAQILKPNVMSEVSPPLGNNSHSGGKPTVLALGFSVRALAQAVVATGHEVLALDYFCDHDLTETAAHCAPAPQILADSSKAVLDTIRRGQELLQNAGQPRVLLAGGTENRLPLMSALHEHFEVLGPSVEQLRTVRDLNFLSEVASAAGLRVPPICRRPEQQTHWLQKRLDSSGGLSVLRMTPQDLGQISCHGESQAGSYFQLEKSGRNLGATLVMSGNPEDCFCLGVTESLCCDDWPGPTEFAYRGSLGPLTLPLQHCDMLLQLGREVAASTGFQGWLQADLIVDDEGNLWLLEFNPRWTAGMEILHDCGRNPVEHQLAAFGVNAGESSGVAQQKLANPPAKWAGKAIVYSERPLRVTEKLLSFLHNLPRANFADIPAANLLGSTIQKHEPLLTVKTHRNANDAAINLPREDMLNELHKLKRGLFSQLDRFE